MPEQLRIGIAEWGVAGPGTVLVTYGLGSCVAIVIYDPARQMAAMAHTLLPEPLQGRLTTAPSAKYTSQAVDLLVAELCKNGCDPTHLVAKLAGGASMFDPQQFKSFRGAIGPDNIAAAKQSLERYNIPLLASDLGGDYGRTVEFHVDNGTMIVRALQREAKSI